MDDLERFERLVEIMDRLRDPGGCPWDREQDFESLRGYLIEECYEVAEALDRSDHRGLQEELGDLLMQIVFLSRVAREQGKFDVHDVIRGISEKMIRRHPHVFGEGRADTSEEVLRHWERIKREEKSSGDGAHPARTSVLDGIPVALPAMLKSLRLGTKAARVGFDWEGPADVLDKLDEELNELRTAIADGRREAIVEEVGDLLFTAVMLARRLEIDPEAALEGTNRKFRERFRSLEAELARRGVPVEEAGIALLERLWGAAKPGGSDA